MALSEEQSSSVLSKFSLISSSSYSLRGMGVVVTTGSGVVVRIGSPRCCLHYAAEKLRMAVTAPDTRRNTAPQMTPADVYAATLFTEPLFLHKNSSGLKQKHNA
ncbi:hypothetical protein E2C01_003443 [Portunus trituberculatus]|uniref:Uncharacterized protein n=1 Tax=Portunus trituberculatus TaxID=210409 RepID=A0A5B7CTK4_PORTR|nr:hypothetical protein [Portunus trituberculatus]